VAGKRLGPAEVESVLVDHPAVAEAAAIGVPHEIKGSALVCFCVLGPEYEPSEELRAALQTKVVDNMGKPMRPQAIRFVSSLPQTRNAKVMRRVIRSAYLGEDPGDISSLVNPEAVAEIRGMA
jgi:acetyl-CoA synthetase